MELTILIPTMDGREHFLSELLFHLNWQLNPTYKDDVEIITDKGEYFNIGEKRNSMLGHAKGKFVVFIDDDDDVSSEYISSFVDAIKLNPKADCIGIKGIISFDGHNEKKWYISKDYQKWFEANGQYYRTPNHISPIRTDIAKKVRFPEINHGEDFAYSMGVYPHLKIEAKIDSEIYHYRFSSPYVAPSSNEGNHPYRPAFR